MSTPIGDEPVGIPIDLVGSGVLWAINRRLLHPMGWALGLRYRTDGSIEFYLQGDGVTPWASYPAEFDRERLAAFTETLRRAKVEAQALRDASGEWQW